MFLEDEAACVPSSTPTLCLAHPRDLGRVSELLETGRNKLVSRTLRRSKTMVYAVRNGAARCRQGVSSVALATHCLGGGNTTGAEEVVVH